MKYESRYTIVEASSAKSVDLRQQPGKNWICMAHFPSFNKAEPFNICVFLYNILGWNYAAIKCKVSESKSTGWCLNFTIVTILQANISPVNINTLLKKYLENYISNSSKHLVCYPKYNIIVCFNFFNKYTLKYIICM